MVNHNFDSFLHRMSVNYFRGSKSFFLSYANEDDADALFGNFAYLIDGNHEPDSGKALYHVDRRHENVKYLVNLNQDNYHNLCTIFCRCCIVTKVGNSTLQTFYDLQGMHSYVYFSVSIS